MKKIVTIAALFAALLVGASPVLASAESAPLPGAQASNWELTRTTFAQTKDGLEFKQTEMGTPDNHAIAILKVPFEGTEFFEIKLRFYMSEFEAGSNDVWGGVGIMGAPKFINWRNDEAHGWAKDSPGLFTRFFNYSGDLRYEASVYQENYHTTGEDPSGQVVDTWQLFEGNASLSATDEVTYRLQWDENGTKAFYNVYLGGECITSSGESSFIDREIIFPDDCIYLLIVMNTQEDDFNDLSKIVVSEINGVSYASASAATDGEGEGNGGCGGIVGIGSSLALLSVAGACLLLRKRK